MVGGLCAAHGRASVGQWRALHTEPDVGLADDAAISLEGNRSIGFIALGVDGGKDSQSIDSHITRCYDKAMRSVYKTKTFARWMRKAELSDNALCKAVCEMEQGLIDAKLGGHVIKKRIPLAGQGKRGGARTLVATNFEDRWFFIFGFAKNDRANIDNDELAALQEVATILIEFNATEIATAVDEGEIEEICNDGN